MQGRRAGASEEGLAQALHPQRRRTRHSNRRLLRRLLRFPQCPSRRIGEWLWQQLHAESSPSLGLRLVYVISTSLLLLSLGATSRQRFVAGGGGGETEDKSIKNWLLPWFCSCATLQVGLQFAGFSGLFGRAMHA